MNSRGVHHIWFIQDTFSFIHTGFDILVCDFFVTFATPKKYRYQHETRHVWWRVMCIKDCDFRMATVAFCFASGARRVSPCQSLGHMPFVSPWPTCPGICLLDVMSWGLFVSFNCCSFPDWPIDLSFHTTRNDRPHACICMRSMQAYAQTHLYTYAYAYICMHAYWRRTSIELASTLHTPDWNIHPTKGATAEGMHEYACMHIYAYACICMHMYACTCVHMHAHACMHRRRDTSICVSVLWTDRWISFKTCGRIRRFVHMF